ncbi:MAG TPA: Hachiman antiphage defense system protein HamA [Thermoleophilaceae bacterium]
MANDQKVTPLDLRAWLELECLDDFGFEAERWTECDCAREAVIDALGREILESYVDRSYLEHRLRKLGYGRLAEHVRRRILPPPGNTRTGDFGEVVSTVVLRRYKGFHVPVLRLRYKDAPGGTQRLIDVVAFKFRDAPDRTVIRVSEVKTRTGAAVGIAASAVKQLRESIEDLPLSLTFIERRLSEDDKHFLADRVLDLLDEDADYDLQEHVFVVTDEDEVRDETLDRIDDDALGAPELTASLVLLTDLAQLIGAAYESAGALRDFAS